MKFTHLNEGDATCVVDVTAKNPMVRQASAVCRVDCSPEVMQALRNSTVPEGDVLAVVRAAGISAAKRVLGLLPLAYTIGVYGYAVDLSLEDDHVAIHATVRTANRMGVEMEALTSVTVAVLAIVDMVKGVNRSARIREARIVAELDDYNGDWVRPEDPQA